MSNQNLFAELIAICGKENVSNQELDRIVYSSDLASLPPLIRQMYKIQQPQYIVRPSTTGQISKIIKLAVQHKIPFTTRAGASTGNGAVIPIDGGIILDLTQMQKIIKIDPDFYQITVQPGIPWEKLNHFLKKNKLMIGIHPSSSPSATVGGFISTGGYAGIGAPKYGPIAQQIQKLKVILPDGSISDIYPPLSSLFVGAEGTLGIIVEITLQVFPLSQKISPFAFGFADIESASYFLQTILAQGVKPYHVMLFDRHFLDLSKSLGLEVPKNEFLLILALEGTEETIQAESEKIWETISDKNKLNEKFAYDEWNKRFKAELFIKRAGPSLILLEVGISLSKINHLYKNFKEISETQQIDLGFCGILGHNATMLCMPFMLTDERNGMDYLKILTFSRRLLSNAIKHGGTLYGVGLWGSSYLPYLHSQEKLRIFREIKTLRDPENLCNPGKIIDDRTPERMKPPKP